MTGIRKTARGWQAYVRVNGQFYSKRFPPDTTLTLMKRWRDEQKVRVRLGHQLPTAASTLATDVRHYLDQVQTMPTLRERAHHLREWIAVFGHTRDRKTLTAPEIRAHLETLRAHGYAASSVNHRRTALMHLFTILDGKSAPNPARDVPRYREAPRPPRALSPTVLDALFQKIPNGTMTKARLLVMRWTGWPPAQIMRLEPSDITWQQAVYIRPRQKGAGVRGRTVPLLAQGWDALKQFRKAGAWGAFSTSSVRKAFRMAALRVQKDKRLPKALREAVADVTPYDLRHSFLTLVAVHSRNSRAVTHLGLHADLRQSARYTEAAVDPLVQAALSEVAKQLPRTKKARKRSRNAA